MTLRMPISVTRHSSDSTPYVKILSASEQPAVYTDDDGILTIAPEECDAEEETTGDDTDTTSPTATPSTAAPSTASGDGDRDVASGAAPKTSINTSLFGGLTAACSIMTFLPTSGRMVSSVLTTLALLGGVVWVANADGHCAPTLSIEVGVPETAPVTQRFGNTTHYLPATVDTVVWGYYDPNATAETAPVTMASGETITVEVITHHSGHDVSFDVYLTTFGIGFRVYIHTRLFDCHAHCYALFSSLRNSTPR